MDVSRRRGGIKTSVVAAGSVWESRMKVDEVKGGIKVFNGGEETNNINTTNQESGSNEAEVIERKIAKKGSSVKRKTWKSESGEGGLLNIGRGRNASVEQGNLCVDVKKSSPIQAKKVGRSDGGDAIVKSPVQSRKLRSDSDEKNQVLLRKPRSDFKTRIDSPKLVKDCGENYSSDSNKSSVEFKKLKSEQVSEKAVESTKTSNKTDDDDDETETLDSDQTCKDFNVVSINNDDAVIDEDGICDDDEEVEDEEESEEEIEKKSVVVDDVIKDIKINQEETKRVEISNVVYEFNNRTAPPTPLTSSVLNHKQPPPPLRRATIYQNLSKPTSVPVSNEYQSFPQTHSKLQNLVDLVMWREISRSAFVFGIGTFIIISSSYTQDLNVSFISVTSYLGLIYLAAIFLYRSLICRGVIDMEDDDRNHVLGEGEAIWLLKLVLPYLNECLLKIRALFSGDPATTMKLAVILFVFARCGNSITIWKMAKLGFFGVFIIPKVCSSYSSQLTGFAKFWIRRFRDAWESCTHKKAVALAIFTLVWNLSSMIARVWAVFMMFVAVRYYQQTMETEDWVVEEDENIEEEEFNSSVSLNKLKKDF